MWLAVFLFFAVLAGLWFFGRIPVYVPAAYLAMSLLTFLSYWTDKVSAERGAWRTSESLLHWLELACGWPGGLAAQWQLRHKNRKREYQTVFWFIVAAHIGVLGWLAWSDVLPTAWRSGAFSFRKPAASHSGGSAGVRKPAADRSSGIVVEVLPRR